MTASAESPLGPVRIFLLAADPGGRRLGENLRRHLEDLPAPTLEVIWLPVPDPASPTPSSPRVMREGDVLVLLGSPASAAPDSFLPFRQRAAHRHLHVVEATPEPCADPETPSDHSRPTGALLHRLLLPLALLSPETDGLLRWTGTDSAPPQGELPPLERLATEKGSKDAVRYRREALTALRARLRGTALTALRHAMDHAPSNALTAYARARVLAAGGGREDLVEAEVLALNAAFLARAEQPRGAIELGSWWLVAHLAAVVGDHRRIDHALAEIGLDAQSPRDERILAASLLTAGQPGAGDPSALAIRHALEPELFEELAQHPPAPFLVPAGTAASTHAASDAATSPDAAGAGTVAALFAAEEALIEHHPGPPAGAREALTHARGVDLSPPRADLHAGSASLRRQIGLLVDWARALVAMAREHDQARTARADLAQARAAVAEPTRAEAALETIWARLAERRDELAQALRATDREIMRLGKREEALRASLRGGLEAFLKSAQRTEAMAVTFPALLGPAVASGDSGSPPGELRVATPQDWVREGIACEPSPLPDPLSRYLGPTPAGPEGPGLYRLERLPDSTLLASRVGVYFGPLYAGGRETA
jgi:hypothetical protein